MEAAAAVLDAQLVRYEDLPREVADLDSWCRPAPPGAVDRAGKFVLRNGAVVLAFGKHQGRPLREIARRHPDYLQWLLRQPDFPAEARALAEKALQGDGS